MNMLQQQKPLQEDFYLLDVVGGASITALHPSKPIVAYNSGCMIIIYDLMTDQKINLVHHQHEIYALAFSPPGAGNSQSGGDYLISIDFDRNDLSDQSQSSSSTMCLWNWQKGQCLQEIQIPKSQNNSTFLMQPNAQATHSGLQRMITVQFEKVGGNFLVLESGSMDMGGGYRATLWNLNRHQRVDMISQLELELQATCLGLSILPRNTFNNAVSQQVQYNQQTSQMRLRFFTLEKQCIKIWEYSQGHADLIKRIMIKQVMKQCIISELTGFLLILGDNGKVLILDQEGEFVSTIQKEATFFTVIGTAHDKLLLGTERGTVCVYHMASLHFINEIPYQLSLLQNFQLNAQYQNAEKSMKSTMKNINPLLAINDDQDVASDQFSVFKIGPPVTFVNTTSNMRFLMIKYQDGSFVLIDRTVQTPSQAIMGYSFGHFQKVSGIQWMSKPSKRGRHIMGENQWQVTTSADTFVTCSNDMSIFIWKHFGDRWSFSFIDVVKCFDHGLTYQRKLIERSTQNLKLTALALYPRQSMLIVGDNKGVVRIFQVSQDKALFMASHLLLKGIEVTNKEDAIVEIHITSDEQYAVVAFESGLICCYDIKNSFNFIGQIEKDAQRFCYSNQLQVSVKILETHRQDLQTFSTFDILRQQEEKLFSNNSFDTMDRLNRPYSQAFRVISTTSPNCVSLRSIEVKGNKLFKTPLAQFLIDEGKVAGFDIHPSQDYLLVTSTQGKIYVYRIDTGELRGTIKIPLHARQCLIDPSGLYVVVVVPPFNQKHTVNLAEQYPGQVEDLQTIGTHENDIERTTLLMFEIGTGMPAAEIKSVFEVSSMRFSDDGKYLTLGSTKGTVCVWAVGEHLYQNIKQVLDSVQMQPDFWCNYPIFLPDYNQMMESPMQNVNMLSMPVDNQIDRPEHYMAGSQMSQPGTQRLSNFDLLSSSKQTMRSYPNAQNNPPQQYNNQGIQVAPQQYQQPIQQQTLQRDPQQQFTRMSQQQPMQYNQEPRQVQYSNDRSVQKNQSFEVKQEQQQKFYRKTFVEDQGVQVTRSYMDSQPRYQNNQSAQIQTMPQQHQQNQESYRKPASRLPDIPDYLDNYQRPLIQHSNRHMSSPSSYQSPNKAELLYQEAYLPQSQNPTFRVPSQQELRPLTNYQSQQNHPQTFSEPRLDFIDRTLNDRLTIQHHQKNQQRQIFFEDTPDKQLPTYEENLDAAHLYNPFQTNSDAIPLSSIQHSPLKRMQPQKKQEKQQLADPVDIDDDVSDHGPESMESQLKQLDGMNKYMQHIRVPTSKQQCYNVIGFANDDFIMVNGNRGGERGYTLERMRQEERVMEAPMMIQEQEERSQSGSTYDLVEEMYENMNNFDHKMKSMKNTY